MNLLAGSLSMGLLLSLLALGVFVAYRMIGTLDLTADGAFGLGAAVAAALLVRGVDPVTATLSAGIAGAAAGSLTALLNTALGVNLLLGGILTTTALYSINLFVMQGGDISLASASTVPGLATALWEWAGGNPDGTVMFGTVVTVDNIAGLLLFLALGTTVALVLLRFLRTDFGLAMRAAGENPQMARALGIDVGRMVIRGLALSNGLIAACGALFAQYQGFANVQMGLGMIVTGLACLMLGEALFGQQTLGPRIGGVLVGSIVFRLLIAVALWAGLNPNALKLVTTMFVLAVLTVPDLVRRNARRAGAAFHG